MTAEEARKLFSPDLNLSPEARSLIAYIGTIGEDEIPYDRLFRMLHITDVKKLRRIIGEAADSTWIVAVPMTGKGHHPRFTYTPPKNGRVNADNHPKNGALKDYNPPFLGTLSESAEQQILEGSLVPVVLTTNPPVGPPLIVGNGKPATTRRGSKFCPADWVPSEKLLDLARQAGLDVEHELALFRDHEFNHPYTDWDRVFRNWIRRAKQALKSKAKPNGIHLTPAQLDAQGVTAVKQKTRMQVEHEERMARRNGGSA